MSEGLRKLARAIFDEALGELDAGAAVERGVSIDVSGRSDIRVLALGKAADRMFTAMQRKLGSVKIRGLIIAHTQESSSVSSVARIVGGHPIPTAASLEAGRAIIEFVSGATADTLLIVLLSGGGSALAEVPADPALTLDEIAEINRRLILSGMPIREANDVRKRISAIKGGKLAALAAPAEVWTLIVSDVAPGDEASVASGPTIPGDERARVVTLLDCRDVAQALGRAAAKRVDVVVNLGVVDGEIAEVVTQHLDALDTALPGRTVAVVSAGEATVRVTGSGLGGRNQHSTLVFLAKAQRRRRKGAKVVFLSAGTDGRDGPTDAAGGIGDLEMLAEAERLGLSLEDALARFDSYRFLEAVGGLVVTGPTGTNVRDARIVIGRSEPVSSAL